MVTTTLSAINDAAEDPDLTRRLVAAAAQVGVKEDPPQFVMANRERLAAAPVSETGDTIASVYAYAVATYQPTPRPGQNPAAVTDAHLARAVEAITQQEVPSA